ncbi:MAG TPA: amidohydrolase family protein [Candidatus Sulfotelmatobacter sp.]|nr:amidohydrolase family protein [Candidatus Sulfotelmatobacter sp.]
MIIAPCTVVTGGPEPQVHDDVGVRIVGSHIAQIASSGSLARAYRKETLWPARGRVLMPGFVNTHAHLARHLARGLGLRSLGAWDRYERALSPEDIRWAVSAALVEGVRHGVTTVCDLHRSSGCVELSLSEIVAAASQVGVRVATGYTASEHDSPRERKAALEECRAFAAELRRKRSGRLKASVGVQATTLGGVETLVAEAFEAAGDQVPVHVDLALDLTPAERWNARGPWRGESLPALWAHVESAPRGLLGAARERGDALSAVGAGSVAALVREAEVAWGSDSSVNAPPLPDGAHALGMGVRSQMHYRRMFVNGASWAAAHFGEDLGQITPGAPADLVLVDYRPATEFSTKTLLDHLWTGLLRAPISGVMVSGEVVMDNGVVLSVDEREVAENARAAARRVWEKLG